MVSHTDPTASKFYAEDGDSNSSANLVLICQMKWHCILGNSYLVFILNYFKLNSAIILLAVAIQVHAAEDRKKIALLLSLSQMTERDIVYLSSLPEHTVVPRAEQSQFIHGVKNVSGMFISFQDQ